MFKISFNKNGQWSLSKSWDDNHIKSAQEWVATGMRDHLKKLPRAEGELRNSMINQLRERAEHRVNQNGEKEYKLYRTAQVDDDKHKSDLSSWTHNPDFAYYWAHINTFDPDIHDETDEFKPNKVMHSWVPEKHIHSYLSTIGDKLDRDENEILVDPHDIEPYKVETGDEIKTNIDKRFKF